MSPGGSGPLNSGTEAYSSAMLPRSKRMYRTTAPSSSPSRSTTAPVRSESSFASRRRSFGSRPQSSSSTVTHPFRGLEIAVRSEWPSLGMNWRTACSIADSSSLWT